jgi:hypothetical protein
VDQPNQRNRQRETGRVTPEALAEPGTKKRPSDDPKQRETADQMDDQIQQVVAPNLEPADGVVDG